MYRKKNVVIIAMCVAALLMIVGYAAFSANLKINGAANITSNWNIYFESITTKQITGSASNAVEPTVSALSARFEYNFKLPGDKIVYEIVLKNGGTLDAIVSEINAEQGGTGQMLYAVEGIKKGDRVLKGESRIITITIEFDREATFIPEIKDGYLTIDLTCIQANDNVTSEDLVVYQPTLKQATYYSGTDQTFFEGPILEKDIESITFTNTKTVPSGVKGSWDVSAAVDEKVMAWYTDSDSDSLYEVTIGQDGGVIANPNSSYLFHYLINVESIDLTYFDTALVTNMVGMFSHCQKLTSLDVSNFDTGKVTTMIQMFMDCPMLTELNLSSFDTKNVAYISEMFYGCSKLTSLDLSDFSTANVTNMYAMFAACYKLKEIDLSNFDTSKVTNMSDMFNNCVNLTNLDLSSFDTSRVTNMYYMFYNCNNLVTLNFSKATFDSVTTYTNMFTYAYSTMTITVKGSTEQSWILDKLSTANVVVA